MKATAFLPSFSLASFCLALLAAAGLARAAPFELAVTPSRFELAGKAGVVAIVQPGGSLRDSQSIAACDELGLAMVFTGHRHFRH